MANLQRKFQRELQERISTRRRRSIGSIFGRSDDKVEKVEMQPPLAGLGAMLPSPDVGNFKRSFRLISFSQYVTHSATMSFKFRNNCNCI